MVSTQNTDDFYSLLGVSKSADEKEIKSAYKQAARKYHPDNKETGSEEMFKKLGEAYETLKDPQKRTIYDQYGKEGLKGAGAGFNGAGFGGEDLSDIFSSFFGGGFGQSSRGRAHRATKGQDHVVDISLEFLDPVNEIKKKIRLNPLVVCSSCDGKGAANEADVVTCTTCNGIGQVSSVQNTILGQIRQTTNCPTCAGRGKTVKNPCTTCKGKGFRRETKEVEVNIPAGVYDGANMRLAGMGDAGTNGGPPGDIYLSIHVKPHSKFERDDAHIYSEISIGLTEAALGTSLEVPTIRGMKKIEIKPGTQSSEVQTLKNEGMPRVNHPGRLGDHYVKIKVVTPKNLTGAEKDLLKELQKLRQGRDVVT